MIKVAGQPACVQVCPLLKYRTDNGRFRTREDLAKVPGLNQKLIDSNKKIIQL